MTLTELRKQRGISQIELSKRIGLSQRSVSAYETGFRKLTLENAHKIAVALGITLDELYELTK